MASSVRSYFKSSVFKKQVVAVTGLAWVTYLLLHLAGNLIVFLGPQAFNHYAEMLHAVPELLWVARVGLIATFAIHIYFTILVTMENRAANGGLNRYAVNATHGRTNFAKKYMILSGAILFIFLIFHLSHFTLPEKSGPATALAGKEYALYGLVWNVFSTPGWVLLYLVGMWCVAMHLSHGIQSMFQSVGFFHDRYTPLIRKAGITLGALVAGAFSIIPLYIFVRNLLSGPPV